METPKISLKQVSQVFKKIREEVTQTGDEGVKEGKNDVLTGGCKKRSD
jgi:hypothetical protein